MNRPSRTIEDVQHVQKYQKFNWPVQLRRWFLHVCGAGSARAARTCDPRLFFQWHGYVRSESKNEEAVSARLVYGGGNMYIAGMRGL
jgi:hypothetical protein